MSEGSSKLCGFVSTREIVIEWGQCDPAGIVYYPRYFDIFNESTVQLFAAAGYEKKQMQRDFGIIGYPMITTNATFHSPCTYSDRIVIRSGVIGWGRSSFEIRHELSKGKVLAVEAYEKRVWAVHDEATGRIRGSAAPQEVVERMLTVNSA